MVKIWILEFGKYGIIFNCVVFGFIFIEMIVVIFKEYLINVKDIIFLCIVVDLIDIVYGYLYLVFEEVWFVLGICLIIDGGWFC